MGWVRLDDRLCLDAKIVAAGNAAVGAWIRALSWAAQQRTDGFVPAGVAVQFGSAKELEAVTRSGLWRSVIEGDTHVVTGRRDPSGRRRLDNVVIVAPGPGYLIENYVKYNPSKAEGERLSEARREAGELGNERKRAAGDPSQRRTQKRTQLREDADANGHASATQSGAPPVPSRPRPVDQEQSSAPSAHLAQRAKASETHPTTLATEAEMFLQNLRDGVPV